MTYECLPHQVRARLLEELRRDDASLQAAYDTVLDTLMEEIELLENDALVFRQAREAQHADEHRSPQRLDRWDRSSQRLDRWDRSPQRLDRWDRERRRNLARFFVLPAYVKDEAVITARA